jgi:hypothetical protein
VGRSYFTSSAVCKQIRREVRTLTATDRESYLASLETLYRSGLREGRDAYGPYFVNNHYLVAVHNSDKYCLHDPAHFLVIHSAFVLWADRVQQMVDPTIVTPYWDNAVS